MRISQECYNLGRAEVEGQAGGIFSDAGVRALRCYIACVLEKLQIFDGKEFQSSVLAQMIQSVRPSFDSAQIAEVLDQCNLRTAELEGCDRPAQLMVCVKNELGQQVIAIFMPQGGTPSARTM